MDINNIKDIITQDFKHKKNLGDNYRNNDKFLAIKKNLSITSDPNSEALVIDWDKLNSLCNDILSNDSKDILVLCYLVIGLFKTDGTKGLTIGINILIDFIAKYWTQMYPPVNRINGRWSAIEWLIENILLSLSSFNDSLSTTETDSLILSLSLLDSEILKKDNNAPNFLSVITELKIIAEQNSAIQKCEDSDKEVVANESCVKESEGFDSIKSAKEKLSNLWKDLQNVSNYLKLNDGEISLAYRLNRISIWQSMNDLPEHDEIFITKVPPPDCNQLKQLKILQEANNNTGIIEICEQWVIENPFWFDLHLAISKSMNNLSEYSSVVNVIKQELLSFYHRFPLVDKLCFSNGMRMMSAETFDWLKECFIFKEEVIINNTQNLDKQSPLEISCLDHMNEIIKKSEKERIHHLECIQHYLLSEIPEKLKIQLLFLIIDCLMYQPNKLLLQAFIEQLEYKLNYFHIDEFDKVNAEDILIKLIKAKKFLKDDTSDLYQRLSLISIKSALLIS